MKTLFPVVFCLAMVYYFGIVGEPNFKIVIEDLTTVTQTTINTIGDYID